MSTSRPRLSVVVPVFNQAASIVENVEVIRDCVRGDLGDDFEIVVVSDGSIDETEDELVRHAPADAVRVFHYDRNLGKGYAVKLGALESRGEWIGFVDADLDLDPGSLGSFVRRGEDEQLDFVIGSKRHPDSQVSYPPSRVAASWLFQQLVRVLFRLNVRDTQVGLKVFRRDVAEQVLPLLLVKRYAFDIELLAVARAFGFERIEEMPVRLNYQFTGSGVRSRAVIRALVDTAAIFYRLRILRYYQRRRALGGAFAFTRPRDFRPDISVLLHPTSQFREHGFPGIDVTEVQEWEPSRVHAAAVAASGELVALLEPGARASANWLAASVPFLARSEIGLVVVPKLAPLGGSLRLRAAAAVDESRIGAGLGYFRYTPGNVGLVRSFPSGSFVARRAILLELPPNLPLDEVPDAVAARREGVLYTPEAIVVAEPQPLFAPHLARVFRRAARRRGGGRLALLTVVLFLALVAAAAFSADGRDIVAVLAVGYLLAAGVAAVAATFRFQSVSVGGLALVGIVLTHGAYVAGLFDGIRRSRR